MQEVDIRGITNYLFQIVLMLLPVVSAGVAFIFILKQGYFSTLRIPIDQGVNFGGKPLLGENKTLLGLLVMSIGTCLATLVLSVSLSFWSLTGTVVFDYALVGIWKSFVYGLAYSLGELPNSFLKRRLGILPGRPSLHPFGRLLFGFFDRADSVLACSLVLLFLYDIPFSYVMGAVVLGIAIHFLTDVLMRKISLK